jgi:hypothetical protein
MICLRSQEGKLLHRHVVHHESKDIPQPVSSMFIGLCVRVVSTTPDALNY